ncbi:MAG: ABC transporter ATP-binding protein [Massiliimalia sp.]|jgi:putative ABC transport system ATP-binding protein
MAFMVLDQVCKRYWMGDNPVDALDHVSMQVETGEFISVVGASGSGKSTLMNILGCLDQPDSGSYWLDQVLVENCSERELAQVRNQKIGFIFQSFHLIPSLDALENVELQLAYGGMELKTRKQLAKEALIQVGLEQRMHHRPGQMSGGQQQRVAIARAIAASPPLILADEPTGNLDSRSAKGVMDILHKLHEQGRTILLITHDDGIAGQADRKLRISDGKLSF